MRWSVCLGLTLMVVASSAQAGGPPESIVQIVVDPNNPDHMALRYEHAGDGLLISTDGGVTFRGLCVAGAQPMELDRLAALGRVGIAGDGKLFVGSFSAGFHDDGTGCGWTVEPAFDGEWITDFANHPSDADVFFAVSSTAPEGDNGVFMRDAAGAWTEVGSRDTTLISRLLVTALPSGDLRLYQSGTRGVTISADGSANWGNHMIRVSDDMGATWTEHLYDVGAPFTFFKLEAVDPTNPDRIVVSLHREGEQGGRQGIQDAVLVSNDQGATFTNFATLTQFGGLSMAEDGRIWIADQGDPAALDQPSGLHFATSLDEPPSILDEGRSLTCLRYLPGKDKLFACARIEAGTYNTDGTGYSKVVDFRMIDEVVGCNGQDNVATCRQQYTRYWCTAAHFNDASLCCPYVDESGLLVGSEPPESLDCSAWGAANMSMSEVDAGGVMVGDGDVGGSDLGNGDGETSGDGDGAAPGDDDSGAEPAEPTLKVVGKNNGDGGCGCTVLGNPRPFTPAWLVCFGLVGLRFLFRRWCV